MLSGGDYNEKGLPGCGPATAMRAVKAGLGQSLCDCRTQKDCAVWREKLVAFLQRSGGTRKLSVPQGFPEFKVLTKYCRPTVSSDEQLLNLRGLRNGWDQPFDEIKLLDVTGTRFDIWGKLYMNWIGRVLLTKWLVSRGPSALPDNPHDIKLKRRLKKDEDSPTSGTVLRKLTFSPFRLSTLKRSDLEGGARQGYWGGKLDVPFDPDHRVDCEVPEYILRMALTSDMLDPPTPVPKRGPQKRKQQAEDEDEEDSTRPSSKKKKKTQTRNPTSSSPSPHLTAALSAPAPTTSTSVNHTSHATIVNLLSDAESDEFLDIDIFEFRTPLQSRAEQKYYPLSAPPPRRPSDMYGPALPDIVDDSPELEDAIWRSLQDTVPRSSPGYIQQTRKERRAVVTQVNVSLDPKCLRAPERPPGADPASPSSREPTSIQFTGTPKHRGAPGRLYNRTGPLQGNSSVANMISAEKGVEIIRQARLLHFTGVAEIEKEPSQAPAEPSTLPSAHRSRPAMKGVSPTSGLAGKVVIDLTDD
jgi:Holliday junction resolvase YEN1